MKTQLLSMLAPLCFFAACATTPDTSPDTDESTASESAAPEIGPVKTDGASCTLHLPASWTTGTHRCSTGGTGTRTIIDGNSLTFDSIGPGAGSCTFHCTNGVLSFSPCTCS